MSIRRLKREDVPALSAALARLPLMQRYRRDASRIEADLAAALQRGDGLLVEEGEAGPRGVAWFLAAGTLAMGGYLRLIAVVPEGTGSGAGARLLQAFEAEVSRESRHAFLLVSDFNQGAQRFYQRHGYARVGALPGLVLPDVAEILYWKRLG